MFNLLYVVLFAFVLSSCLVAQFSVEAREVVGLIRHAFSLLGVKPDGYKVRIILD